MEGAQSAAPGRLPSEKERGPFCLIRYCSGDDFKELPNLDPDLEHPTIVECQLWRNSRSSWSSVTRVKALLRECGVPGMTFLITRDEQRPWAPPIGYQCVYESYFRKNT